MITDIRSLVAAYGVSREGGVPTEYEIRDCFIDANRPVARCSCCREMSSMVLAVVNARIKLCEKCSEAVSEAIHMRHGGTFRGVWRRPRK